MHEHTYSHVCAFVFIFYVGSQVTVMQVYTHGFSYTFVAWKYPLYFGIRWIRADNIASLTGSCCTFVSSGLLRNQTSSFVFKTLTCTTCRSLRLSEQYWRAVGACNPTCYNNWTRFLFRMLVSIDVWFDSRFCCLYIFECECLLHVLNDFLQIHHRVCFPSTFLWFSALSRSWAVNLWRLFFVQHHWDILWSAVTFTLIFYYNWV